MVGIGGFGSSHVRAMSELAQEGRIEIPAFAELQPDRFPEQFERLTALGAAHYTDYEQMLADHPEIDFVAIATPIAAHKPMCVRVLEMGFHVLVEKPPAVTIQDLDEIIAARKASGKLCQVDFQNTSGRAFRELLDRLHAGAIGEVKRVTGVGIWSRSKAYYARTPWAGKLTNGGKYVLDGTFNNPFAHLLNNCLLAAGDADPSRMLPQTVQAELYRVNDIEGDDVSCIRAVTHDGVEVLFYAMLCHPANETPFIAVEGTLGEIVWHYDNRIVQRIGGEEEVRSFGEENLMRNMYDNLMQAIANPDVPLFAPIEASRGFVLVSNGAYESSQAVRTISGSFVTEQEAGDSIIRLLPALSEGIREAASQGLLYSEVPFPWAKPTEPARMDAYRHFELPPGYATEGRTPPSGVPNQA
nr:Gfo/Idh/MocA family oxidoreductase [Cohnella zeiphila]